MTVVVGSGIAAARLSPSDAGLQLLENSTATAFGLAVLILVFGPVSGGHFNPVISAVDWMLTRRPGNGLSPGLVAMYATAQLIGAILGALLANIMFDLPAVQISGTDRVSLGHGLESQWLLRASCWWCSRWPGPGGPRCRRPRSAPILARRIGSPAPPHSRTPATAGRIFSDTFAGIAPASALFFMAAQLLGGLVGLSLVRFFFPDASVTAGRAVVPHPNHVPEESWRFDVEAQRVVRLCP